MPTIMILFWFMPAWSDTAPYADLFENPVQMGQHETLDRVGERLQQVNVLRADFRQEKQMKMLRRPLLSSGTYLFAAEHGIYWHTVKPFDSVFMLTPQAIYQKSAGSEALAVDVATKPALAGFTQVFLSLFSGDSQVLEEKFALFFQGKDEDWQLGLRPKGMVMKKVIDRLVLQGGETVTQLDIFEANGDHTRIFFENIQTGGALSDGERERFKR